MSYASDVLERGRVHKSAVSVVDNSGLYRFASYSYGIGRTVRVCPELDAVIEHHISSQGGETYRAFLRGEVLPTKFRKRQKAVEAVVAEAKKKGII